MDKSPKQVLDVATFETKGCGFPGVTTCDTPFVAASGIGLIDALTEAEVLLNGAWELLREKEDEDIPASKVINFAISAASAMITSVRRTIEKGQTNGRP